MLNIRPWETGRLARVEFDALCTYIDEREEQERNATA
jgi:hypothetical protein